MSSSHLVAATVQSVPPKLASVVVSRPLASIEQPAVPSTMFHSMLPSPEPPMVSRSRVEP